MSGDLGMFLGGMALFITALVVLGAIADWWEHRDARRRNRRRVR